jgi:carbon monoxide dehydrogenase subunit G
MAWIRSASNRTVTIRTDRKQLHALLLDVANCGRLMPGVEELAEVGDDLYHYRLAPVSNGAVTFTPDYVAKFDTSDPDAITWQPHGEHNFRTWGTFRVSDGPVPGELTLQIDTKSEASVPVAPVVVVLIEPFARKESDEVTVGFLAAIADAVTAGKPVAAVGQEAGAR